MSISLYYGIKSEANNVMCSHPENKYAMRPHAENISLPLTCQPNRQPLLLRWGWDIVV